MNRAHKRLQARFYEAVSGRLPVREWLLSLSDDDRQTVGVDIAKVEFGWPVGLPSCRPMGNGLFEIRSSISDGRITRIMFGIAEGRMILLHGFVKKKQATANEDLELARKRLKEVKS